MQFLFDEDINGATTFEDTEDALAYVLSSGCRIWVDDIRGRVLIETRARVDEVKGLKIYIYGRDHAPPHFHVVTSDIDACFAIGDGSLIKGKISAKDRDLITWWFQQYRAKLVQVWNKTRPDDCPVGPFVE